MSSDRKLRSDRSLNLLTQEDTPTKRSSSRITDKKSSRQIEKQQSSARVVKQQSVSQQQGTLFSDDDRDPLVHSESNDNITNDTSTVEDKPEHLYEDTPTKRSSSRITDKKSSRQIEKQQSSARVVKQQSVSQQQGTLFSDDDRDPLVHFESNDSVANNTSTIEDKPEHLYGDTPTKRSSSRITDKKSSRQIEKRQSSARVVKQQSVSQQQDTLFSDDDRDPLVHSESNDNITNDISTFEDKPEHLYEDTPRKRSGSRIADKKSSLQIEKRQSSARVVKRQSVSQQQDTLFSDNDSDPENNDNITNDTSTFEDKPEHLYGLDNPTKEVSEGTDESENTQAKPETKHPMKCSAVFIACLCFIFLLALTGLLSHHLNQKQQHGDDKAEIKLLKNRIHKLEQAQSNQSMESFRDYTYQKVLLKDQSKTCEGKPVENMIEEALHRWDADKIGIPDYALESAGGQIHGANHSPTFASEAIPQVLVFGIPVWYDVKLPRVIIQPGNTPGECWAFQGSSGFIVLKLSRLIKPTSFTLEHMAATLSQFEDHSIPSAPREFSVWGWADARGDEKVLLGEYVYIDRGHALQNFPVQATTVPEFRYIELKVLSNYGNPVFTCLYRFRVHGLPYKTNN